MPHLSLVSVLQESALRRPEKIAAIEGDRRATYAELWSLALRRAAALREAGVEPGDRVALLGLNTVDFVTAYYGILARGAVVVPIAPMLVADEIAFLLEDSGAKVALVADDLEDVVAGGAEAAGVQVLTFSAALAADAAGAPRGARAAGRRGVVLHLGHDRAAQGRDADALQPGDERVHQRLHGQPHQVATT